MAVNKVIFAGDVLIDLTSDTVTAETLLSGVTAHKADGTVISGKMFNRLYNQFEVTFGLIDSDNDYIKSGSGDVIEGSTKYRRL